MIFYILLVSMFCGTMLVQGYLEELFNRVEKTGFTSPSEIKSWLAGNRNKSSYINISNQLAEPFGVRELITQASTYDEIQDLKSNAKGLQIKDQVTLNQVDELVKSSELSGEIEEKIGRVRSQKSLERLKKDTNQVTFRKKLIVEKIDIKITEAQRSSGKLLTVYTKELRILDTESEIDNLLDRALDEIGEGKSYDSLVERAGFKREMVK